MWPLWERFARVLWPTVDVPYSTYRLLSIHIHEYKGWAFTLADGVEIRRGDLVAELHFNNAKMMEALGDASGSQKWLSARMFRDGLEALARWMAGPAFHSDVKAIYGVTILARSARRLGFSVRPRRSTLGARVEGIFLAGLLAIYTAEGADRLVGTTPIEPPGEIWMSRAELMSRYGPQKRGGSRSR